MDMGQRTSENFKVIEMWNNGVKTIIHVPLDQTTPSDIIPIDVEAYAPMQGCEIQEQPDNNGNKYQNLVRPPSLIDFRQSTQITPLQINRPAPAIKLQPPYLSTRPVSQQLQFACIRPNVVNDNGGCVPSQHFSNRVRLNIQQFNNVHPNVSPRPFAGQIFQLNKLHAMPSNSTLGQNHSFVVEHSHQPPHCNGININSININSINYYDIHHLKHISNLNLPASQNSGTIIISPTDEKRLDGPGLDIQLSQRFQDKNVIEKINKTTSKMSATKKIDLLNAKGDKVMPKRKTKNVMKDSSVQCDPMIFQPNQQKAPQPNQQEAPPEDIMEVESTDKDVRPLQSSPGEPSKLCPLTVASIVSSANHIVSQANIVTEVMPPTHKSPPPSAIHQGGNSTLQSVEKVSSFLEKAIDSLEHQEGNLGKEISIMEIRENCHSIIPESSVDEKNVHEKEPTEDKSINCGVDEQVLEGLRNTNRFQNPENSSLPKSSLPDNVPQGMEQDSSSLSDSEDSELFNKELELVFQRSNSLKKHSKAVVSLKRYLKSDTTKKATFVGCNSSVPNSECSSVSAAFSSKLGRLKYRFPDPLVWTRCSISLEQLNMIGSAINIKSTQNILCCKPKLRTIVKTANSFHVLSSNGKSNPKRKQRRKRIYQ